ncbi:BppU family phage baseplate upper protein [Staphylococcus aureus]|uniref:BppU family phage baseplate upper protein n=1 Tax=Staphylococcus aureus TaxID=1280 RepID=UPI000DE46E48|nr:BppU family phage baseplate upper protein [Staphylococcus aureus]
MAVDNFSKDDNLIELQTTSKYKPIVDTNISFYTSDRGTGVLNFAVTKNNKPLSISNNHAKADIVLKTDNYDNEHGAYISDKLTITDPINGRMHFVIPNEFMKYTGKVHAQVYFTQNGSNNVVVERRFSFNIEDDLISNFDGETKLVYIKSIHDLTASAKEEVDALKKSIGGINSLVTEVDSLANQGIKQIEIKQNEAVQMIVATQNSAEQAITEAFNRIIEKEQSILKQINKVEKQINDADLVKGNATNDWQKSKLTDDEGKAIEMGETTIETVLSQTTSTKLYHISKATDAPAQMHVGTEDIQTLGQAGLLSVYIVDDQTARAIWYPDDSNNEYTTYKIKGTWYPFRPKNNEEITKDFVESTAVGALNKAKSYVDDKLEKVGRQKVGLTKENGELEVVSGLDLNNPEARLQHSQFVYLISAINTPDSSSDNGILHYYKQSYDRAQMVYSSYNSNKQYLRNKNADTWSGWSEVAMIDNTNPFDTVRGVQAKVSVAESNARNYTDSKFNGRQTVLFRGSANGVGSTIRLNESLDQFSLLIFYGFFPGGDFVEFGDPEGNGGISLNPVNLPDRDGNGGGIYEVGLTKTSRTLLTISNDVFFDLGKGTGSGANANKGTIKKIIGVRK